MLTLAWLFATLSLTLFVTSLKDIDDHLASQRRIKRRLAEFVG